MENSKQNNLININNINKDIKNSMRRNDELSPSNIKMSLKDFPTLNTLYSYKFKTYFNNNSIIKRSATEEFKQNTIVSSKRGHKTLFNGNEKFEIKNNSKKTKFKKRKKLNHKTNLGQNRKKYISNKDKNNQNNILNSIPKNINRDCLVNVVTVKQAKELKKAKTNNFIELKTKNDFLNKKPKIKKFKNKEIIQVNNELNNDVDHKSKIFSNLEFNHQFDNQIAPIINRKFKNLEMEQELEEKKNTNRIKRFDNIDIYQSENDLHFIDNINQIKDMTNNTISENITYENIENKIKTRKF